MGRAPCCDKANVKKGPWSPEEDTKLKGYIEQHGTGGNWIALPQKIGLRRCGKSCRLRWLNYLRPNIKHGGFSEEEDNIICSLYISIGSRWSIIAAQLPGRTDNDIKNYWNTRLKKKLLGKQRKEQHSRRASCLKQEIKKGSENFVVADSRNHIPYWPELPDVPAPVSYPNEDPDHGSSIRKFLINIGERFSDDHHQLNNEVAIPQCPLDISSSTQHQLYENHINLLSSSTPMNSLSNTYPQFSNTYFDIASMNLLQGLNNFPVVAFNEMVSCNPQRIEGLECYYDMGMVSNSTGANSVESTSWGDISPSVYPPQITNYESHQQVMLKDCPFEESRYLPSSQ